MVNALDSFVAIDILKRYQTKNRQGNMAYWGKKTEHNGPKKGKGAYYGRKKNAKLDSRRTRRAEDKRQPQQ